jgi:hypothetical protein
VLTPENIVSNGGSSYVLSDAFPYDSYSIIIEFFLNENINS